MNKLMHVLESQQFDRELMEDLFNWAKDIASGLVEKREIIKPLHGRLMINFFYEPSTRTMFSFGIAMKKMGGEVISTSEAKQYSSVAKGETLKDTIRTLCEYCPDVIVLRSPEQGWAKIASEICDKHYPNVHIINAGDGKGQHPTQALLDMYTIYRETGTCDNHKIALVGDLKNGRTARSLAYLSAKFSGNKLSFVSPRDLLMEKDIKQYLKENNVEYRETRKIGNAIKNGCDIFYMTRPRTEYGTDPTMMTSLTINNETANRMREDAIIMHPFPRNNEINEDVDGNKRASYFRQMRYGLEIRMALLYYLFSCSNQ
jgi:aspartate carbamoyltransferase catalytic subunit